MSTDLQVLVYSTVPDVRAVFGAAQHAINALANSERGPLTGYVETFADNNDVTVSSVREQPAPVRMRMEYRADGPLCVDDTCQDHVKPCFLYVHLETGGDGDRMRRLMTVATSLGAWLTAQGYRWGIFDPQQGCLVY